MFLLQKVDDSVEKADEVDGAIVTLSDGLHRIRVIDGFREVLTGEQLDDVDCAALNLSAAVTSYLTMAIEYYTPTTMGMYASLTLLNLVGHAKNLLTGREEFEEAKKLINVRINEYHQQMGSLTAIMVGEGLKHDALESRQDLLDWIWAGNEWGQHQFVKTNKRKVKDIGMWILEDSKFKEWVNGTSRFLIGYGMGIHSVFES